MTNYEYAIKELEDLKENLTKLSNGYRQDKREEIAIGINIAIGSISVKIGVLQQFLPMEKQIENLGSKIINNEK